VKLTPILLGILTTAAGATASFVPSIASAEMLSVKAQSANFRSSPNDKASIIYSADKFYPVEVVERKSGWVKVKDFEGDTAWVAERVLTKTQTIVIEAESANIREKPTTESEVVFKVAHGEVFKVAERKDDWVKVIDAHGDGGWIRADKTWGIDEPKDQKGDKKGDKKPDEGDKKGASHAKSTDTTDAKAGDAKTEDKKGVDPSGQPMECTCRVVHDSPGAQPKTADVSEPPKVNGKAGDKKPDAKPAGKPHDKKPKPAQKKK